MITIEDLINKIKWDKRENPNEYCIFYLDRIARRLVEIKYTDIKDLDEGFMVLDNDGEEVKIPIHRIREVRKKGEVFWRR